MVRLVALSLLCFCGCTSSIDPPTEPPPVASIAVTPSVAELLSGDTLRFSATLMDAEGKLLENRAIEWASSDPTALTISDIGLATAKVLAAVRDVSVTATAEGISESASVLVRPVSAAGDGIIITRPGSGALVPDAFPVFASVSSQFQLESVIVTVGTTRTAMSFTSSSSSACTGGTISEAKCWRADVDISAEPFGALDLTVSTTDVMGGTQRWTIPVVHDPPPTVTVTTAPEVGAVAFPDLHVTFSCADANSVACESVSLRIVGEDVILTGSTSLDATVSLAAYAGRQINLVYAGTDSAGQVGSVTSPPVWVLSAPALERVAEVVGSVLDYDGSRTLYAAPLPAGGDAIRIRDAGGGETAVLEEPGVEVWRPPDYAHLFPAGAIFSTTAGLYELRLGVTSSLGQLRYQVARASHALLRSGSTLHHRNLMTGEMTEIATDADAFGGDDAHDIDAGGNVAYYNGSNADVVYVSLGGAPEILSTGPRLNTHPRIDGSIVTYRKRTPAGPPYSVSMSSAEGGEIELTTEFDVEPRPGRDYAVRDGWVAFTQPSFTGELQVWSRDPAGATVQVTFFGSSSRIDAMGPSGALVLSNGGSRYLATPPYESLASLGNAIGTVRYRNGRFVVLLGGSVFEVP